jgi:membrane-associated phospholipid phosphatase
MTGVRILDQVGRVVKQPPFWGAAAGAMAVGGGDDGKRAAIRASCCYVATAAVSSFLLKPIANRARPKGAGPGPFSPLTSSMPSGHAASDTAFAVGAYQEMQSALVPMLILTTASHWSLVRSHSHFLTDILIGDLVGVAVAIGSNLVWPSKHFAMTGAGSTPRPGVVRHQGV